MPLQPWSMFLPEVAVSPPTEQPYQARRYRPR